MVALLATLLASGCTRVVLKREVRLSRNLTAGQTVRIALHSAAVTIVGSLGSELSVTGELRVTASSESDAETMLREIAVRVRVDGKHVIVEQTGPQQTITRHASLRLTISLPAAQSVSVQLDAGDIDARQLRGVCKLETKNGKISLASSQPPTLTLSTRNGAVSLSQVSTPNARVRITSGRLTLERFNGSIDAQLDSGTVSGSLETLAKANRVRVGSGAIELALGSHADLRVSAHVRSGTVSSTLPSQGDRLRRTLVLGKGRATLELSTESGTIRLTR